MSTKTELPPAPTNHDKTNQDLTRVEIVRRIEDMKRRLAALAAR